MIIRQSRDTLSPTYIDAVKIRQKVFVQEQGVPLSMEIDEKEALCLHIVAYDDKDIACATCRILPDSKFNKVTLQRMAVLANYRGQKLGQFLMQETIAYCKKQGFKTMELHAQLTAKPFYDKLGFTSQGDIFQEAGIDHQTMVKEL
ncbi:GNAT family N-acetyltransferase [Streptococcus parauberis]|uniref:GNAT family N-acetyltransferase n=1 Tax=Streptococcus parauberis TaxID=1348 RepID=UPI0037BCDF91